MKRSLLTVIAVSVIIASVAGIGFAATYTATTVSNDNTVEYYGNTVEFVNLNGDPVGNSLAIAGPTVIPVGNEYEVTANTVWINNYKIKINAEDNSSLYIRCCMILDDIRSWAIIQNVSLTVNDGTTDRNLTLLDNSTSTPVSSVASEAVSLPEGSHSFSLSVTYRHLVFNPDYESDLGFLDLTGAKLVVVAGETDPLSSS